MSSTTLFVTQDDLRELRDMIDRAQADSNVETANLAKLKAELERARVVAPREVPHDAVTMNSTATLYDLDTREREVYTLVYPWQADAEDNRISVLAPIGTAMIGARVGDTIKWPVPAGMRRFRIEELIYQPEREGALTSAY
jgi:regulator of nucleoside diphosphate kinase